MRKIYFAELKTHLHDLVVTYRKQHKITQAYMAERLCMDVRSYSYFESGKNTLGTLSFVLFLLDCDNPADVIDNISKLFEEIRNNVA